MEDPGMFPVPDISFDGAPGEGYRAQVGPEALYQAKWFPGRMGRWWSVSASHRVVGLVTGVVGSRVTGEDR